MSTTPPPGYLSRLAESQLRQQVLPVWSSHALSSGTGVMTAMDAKGQPIQGSPAGSLMNARALWSFAVCYRIVGGADLLMTAMHLYDGFCDQFIEPDSHLVRWQTNDQDPPRYPLLGQTYALYAVSQFAQATQSASALQLANHLKTALNRHFQRDDGTFTSATDGHSDPATSEKNLTSTCNQLHVLEALTQLYLIDPTDDLKQQLTHLIDVFLIHIFPASEHLTLMFDRVWTPQPGETSIGHNFEAPWLVAFACHVLNDAVRLKLANRALLSLVDISLDQARHTSGNFYFGQSADGQWRPNFSWWTQTEASNACLWAYQVTGDERYLTELKTIWHVIQRDWVDNDHGEWHSELNPRLKPAGNTNKGDIWRSCYHTTRACLALSHGFATLEWTNNTTPTTEPTRRTSTGTQFAGHPFMTL